MSSLRWILTVAAAAVCASGQSITQLKLRVDPENRRIRPNETAVVQVQVFGTALDASGATRTGRLRRDGWNAHVMTSGGGAVTKPFRFQGPDAEDYVDTRKSEIGRILNQEMAQYTVKDSFLYVAPAKAGKYTVRVEMAGKSAETTMEVAADAPSRVAPEKTTFPESRPASTDPYRKLAERYAPFIAQETWFTPKADYLARFDYDGDWRGDNNWDNLESGTSQAWVYYAAMETPTHVFLHYNFWHPRDYSDNCVIGTCHENDNEGMIVAIQKDGTEFGRLQTVETLAHNNVYSYVNDASLRPGLHDIEGAVAFWQGSHPMIFLEAGGHGAYKASDARSLFSVDRMAFANTGVTFVYKGKAERPSSPVAREVGYDLLPIDEEWWSKSISPSWTAPTFADYFLYRPYGGRPRGNHPRISGAFLGVKESPNKARPFWGWFDERGRRAKMVATGQWGLDPAYSLSVNLTFPQNQLYSVEYLYNPYFDIDTGTRVSMKAPEKFVAAAPVAPGSIPRPVAATSRAAEGGFGDPAGGWRGALGQVLGNTDAQQKLGAILQRAGAGARTTDAIRQAAGLPDSSPQDPGQTKGGQCVIALLVPQPTLVTLRGTELDGLTDKPQCSAPLPSASVQARVERRSGPADPEVAEVPAQENQWAFKFRLPKAGAYEVVVRW